MEAIILAGGLGTRLASKLDGIPKAMAPVAGRPFLEILLNQLKLAGCTRVLLSVGHLHSVIQDHFGASFRGLHLDYVIEGVPLWAQEAESARRSMKPAKNPSWY